MNINFIKKPSKHRRSIILIGLIISIIGLALLSVNIFAETPADCGYGTNVSPKECWTCLDITASPTTISPGESPTLTLYLDNRPNGTAVCSINQGVLSPTTLTDGTYNYTVSPSDTITYTATCSGIGGTKSDSVTITVLNNPPTATDLSVDQGDYCSYPLHPIFSWTFSDPDPGDIQGAYRVQVDGIDSGKIYSSSNSYTFPNPFSYNRTYSWQLKVWDDRDGESGWISGPSFTTPLHAWPYPDFTWFPPSPTEGEIVQLCATQESGVCPEDVSTCYTVGGPIPPPSCSGKAFLWTFPSGTEFATGTSPASENPRVKFDSTGVKNVTLKITDDVGFCSRTKSVGVMLPLPRWREVAP